MIDRIDIHIEVPRVPYQQLTATRNGTDSATMREQVVRARERQSERTGNALRANATLSGRELDRHAVLDEAGQALLKQAMTELGLRARAYDKVRRVARTIADVDGAEHISAQHVAEATRAQGFVKWAFWSRTAA